MHDVCSARSHVESGAGNLATTPARADAPSPSGGGGGLSGCDLVVSRQPVGPRNDERRRFATRMSGRCGAPAPQRPSPVRRRPLAVTSRPAPSLKPPAGTSIIDRVVRRLKRRRAQIA